MEERKNSVYSVTKNILMKLSSTRDSSQTKALLANLRNSINNDFYANINTISVLFSNIPDEFLGSSSNLNYYEESILTVVELYALHQQGKSESVFKSDYNDGEYRENMGYALSFLRSEDSQSIDSRFNIMVTSTTFKELKHHLRQMIKILKSKSDVKVDYAKLAEDLYWFLMGRRENIKIQWSRSYYRYRKIENKGGEN